MKKNEKRNNKGQAQYKKPTTALEFMPDIAKDVSDYIRLRLCCKFLLYVEHKALSFMMSIRRFSWLEVSEAIGFSIDN